MFVYVNETSAALRRIPVDLVSASDGVTPIIGAAGVSGQIMLSKNGATPVTAAHQLTSVGNGSYYYQCSATEHDTPGFLIGFVSVSLARAFKFLVECRHVNFNSSADLGMSKVPSTIVGGTDLWSVSLAGAYATGTAGWQLNNTNQILFAGRVCVVGALNTFRLDTGASPEDGFYEDQLLVAVSGTGQRQAVIIEGYTGTTRQVSTATSLITAFVTGTEVVILPFGVRGLTRTEVASAVWEMSVNNAIVSTAGFYLTKLDASVGTRLTTDGTVVATSVIQKTGFTVSIAASAITSAALASDAIIRLGQYAAFEVWEEPNRAVTSVQEKTGFTVSIATSAIGKDQYKTSAFRDIHYEVSAVERFIDSWMRRDLASVRAGDWGTPVTSRSALGAFSKLVNRLRVANGTTLEIYREDDSTIYFTQTINTSASASPIIEVDTA